MKVYGVRAPSGLRLYENKQAAFNEYYYLTTFFPTLTPPVPFYIILSTSLDVPETEGGEPE